MCVCLCVGGCLEIVQKWDVGTRRDRILISDGVALYFST